jgi:predicted nuclease with TOPRIM domain
MILAPISIGELVDKITILELKASKTTDAIKLANIQKELRLLNESYNSLHMDVTALKEELHKVNSELWDIEDNKRKREQSQTFDSEFIQLARSVYIKNDIRANIKKQINIITNSGIVEEKIY